MNKNRIVKSIYDGVKFAAIHRSRNKEQAEDLLQEAMLAVLEAIDKYANKPDDEIIRICSTVAYNRIADAQKREINWNRRSIYTYKMTDREVDKWDEDPAMRDPSNDPYDDSFVDEVHERMFLSSVMSRLSKIERIILRERIRPSDRTYDIAEREIREKLIRRSDGELVMNVHELKITDTHIAKSVNISKATMSRISASIREKTEQLLTEIDISLTNKNSDRSRQQNE